VGLISDQAWADFQSKQERLAKMKKLMEGTRLTSEMVSLITAASDQCHPERSEAEPNEVEGPCVSSVQKRSVDWSSAFGQTLAQFLKRPEITIEQLAPILKQLAPEFVRNPSVSSVPPVVSLSSEVRNELKSVETEIKYEGYLLQQQRAMERLKKSEQHAIPEWFDYKSVSGLSREMQEKLTKVRPRTIGQASRIPGVTPAAISLVNVYIEIQARRREQAAAI
jgi:tRNA uridine 5-carboxymethylaminomethyl modification enzyme